MNVGEFPEPSAIETRATHSGPAGKKNGQNSRLPRNLSKNISTTDKMVLYTPYFNSPFPSV